MEIEAGETRRNAHVVCGSANGSGPGTGALGDWKRGHADGTAGLFYRVSHAYRAVVALAGELSAGLQQSQRAGQSGCLGHLDAFYACWSQALFPRHHHSVRWSQSRAAGHEQGDFRRRPAQCLEAHCASRGMRLAGWTFVRQRCPAARRCLDSGHRYHRQAALRQTGRRPHFHNPKKPGRPSHTYHTYLMAGLRQVLGVEVHRGNEHAAKHTQPGLLKILDDLPEERKPALVRGDSSFGNDPLMTALEERRQPYLFKLKLSKNVKRHIGRLFRQPGWVEAGQGWEGKDGELALMGWHKSRRVVVLRRPLMGEIVVAGEEDGQQLLAFVEADRKAGKGITGYEYAVLTTNTGYEILSLGQLYRDRADAENAFDELKNQWGWGGFTTHDLHRCQLSARAVALIYNWWSLFVRLANPQARREAITSRPWLMSAVGRRTEHAGQTTITLTGQHADFGKARAALMRVSALLQGWVARAAEQLNATTVWNLVCHHLKCVLAGIGPPQNHRFLAYHANGI